MALVRPLAAVVAEPLLANAGRVRQEILQDPGLLVERLLASAGARRQATELNRVASAGPRRGAILSAAIVGRLPETPAMMRPLSRPDRCVMMERWRRAIDPGLSRGPGVGSDLGGVEGCGVRVRYCTASSRPSC